MLYIVLAYLMLFAALNNAVCLYNDSFFGIDFCKCFFIFMLCHCLLTQFVYFIFFISIMNSAFNLFVFPNSMFTLLLLFLFFFVYERALYYQIDIHLKYCQLFTLVLTYPVFSSNTLPTK